MNHLHEMCCAACREKLEEIEARANTVSDELSPAAEAAQAFEDRVELLDMVEGLLLSIAVNRKTWAELAKLLPHLLPPAQAE